MKIISSFKDYYDISSYIFGNDQDPNIKFIRETKNCLLNEININSIKKEIEFCKEILRTVNHITNNSQYFGNGICICGGIILFCGKVYPYYTFNLAFQPIIIFGYNKLISKLSDKNFIDSKLKNIDYAKHEKKKIKYTLEKITVANKWYNNLLEHKDNYTIGDDIFKFFDCPVLSVDDYYFNVITKNPILNHYRFHQVFDPYLAYQEIEMYLGNNLAKQMDPEIKLSDEIKAEIHGFDKWSFRKQSSKI